ncbi:MAG: indolepyruvate oxidoreductase [Betaproteobacteria bacterium SG8_40]|nr:MAG: indolepyruvate oxidoreductase [Betaproteobacteria bacterium SG8_40]
MNTTKRPITVLICALGGEGGGVLVEWLVRTATALGYPVQSTSIPGVAQRTGSTTYYLEVFPVPVAELGGRQPVFSLYPVPGDLDILVSSELLETVRQIGNGMVSPTTTRVLTSTSRTLTTAEKMQAGDARVPVEELLSLVRKSSAEHHAFDMTRISNEAGTVVSAVLMGAIAGSGWLPFPFEAFEATIRQSQRGVDASLAGFARAADAVRAPAPEKTADGMPESSSKEPAPQEVTDFPEPLREVVALGYARLVEYQGRSYARLYLARLRRIVEAERAADPSGEQGFAVALETARYLALWMAFDDIVRVADLKCRGGRFARVRREVKARPDELVRVYDFFKPGMPELAGLLPAFLAQPLLRWDARRRRKGKTGFAVALKVGAHSLSGFLALRAVAGMRWLRPRGMRFALEQELIERWLGGIVHGMDADWQVGFEIAACARLIKGYGSTNERGKENLLHVLAHLIDIRFDSVQARADAIRSARESAMCDDSGKALDRALVNAGAPARPAKAQPVIWVKKPRRTAG